MSVPFELVSSQDWSLSLGDPGLVVQGVDDIQQCLSILLNTHKGSDPTRPEFGCAVFEFIDKPVSTAIPNMKKGIAEAVATYEPRVKIIRILHSIDVAQVKFTIEWKYADGISKTLVTYGISS